MQMPISTQRKLRLLVLLQKKYLYTCKNIVTKPNLEEFLRKLFEQYRIVNVANNVKYAWQLTGVFFPNTFHFYCNLFCYLLTYLFTYLFFYFLLRINVVDLLSIKREKKNFAQKLPTTPKNMQRGVQTDAACNIEQCWELLANNAGSVFTEQGSGT